MRRGVFLINFFLAKYPKGSSFAPLAQSVERRSNKPKVNSSILLRSTKKKCLALIVKLVITADFESVVLGSNPGRSTKGSSVF